jgi:2-polyprenyl-3-methyl-5-hydroxy-6-metoxy-1,4-benzoquinol methylase
MIVSDPLSQSKDVVLLEEIETAAVQKLYKRYIDHDMSADFSSLEKIGFYHCLESDLRFFSPIVTGNDIFYEKLQSLQDYYMDDKEEFDFAKTHIKESDFVLEIGSGKGSFAKKISCSKYLGLEFNQKAIKQATECGIEVICETIEDHATKYPHRYDVVCSFQVLEHISDIRSFIESSIKCLKPGGILIYSVPNHESFLSMLVNNALNMPPHHLSVWSQKSLEYVGKSFNLELLHLHVDKLADIHKRAYLTSVIVESIERSLGDNSYKSKLINHSVKYKIINRIADKAAAFLESGLSNTNSLPCGHSITAAYKNSMPLSS